MKLSPLSWSLSCRQRPTIRTKFNSNSKESSPVLSGLGKDNETEARSGPVGGPILLFFFGAALTASKAIRIDPNSRSGSDFCRSGILCNRIFCGPHATPTSSRTQKDPGSRRKKKKKGKRLGKLGVYTLTPKKSKFSGRMHVCRYIYECQKIHFVKVIFQKKI